jgi:hypothetical protein
LWLIENGRIVEEYLIYKVYRDMADRAAYGVEAELSKFVHVRSTSTTDAYNTLPSVIVGATQYYYVYIAPDRSTR